MVQSMLSPIQESGLNFSFTEDDPPDPIGGGADSHGANPSPSCLPAPQRRVQESVNRLQK